MKKLIVLLASLLALGANAEGEVTKEVFISPGVVSIDVNHQGEVIKLQRDQDRDNEISSFYVKTTRGKIQKCIRLHRTQLKQSVNLMSSNMSNKDQLVTTQF